MRRKTISTRNLDRRGWARCDDGPSKLSARYEHVHGWRLTHCGHPTALHPWILTDPRGRLVLAGAAGPHRNPTFGYAWDTLDEATAYVYSLDLDERRDGLRFFKEAE